MVGSLEGQKFVPNLEVTGICTLDLPFQDCPMNSMRKQISEDGPLTFHDLKSSSQLPNGRYCYLWDRSEQSLDCPIHMPGSDCLSLPGLQKDPISFHIALPSTVRPNTQNSKRSEFLSKGICNLESGILPLNWRHIQVCATV